MMNARRAPLGLTAHALLDPGRARHARETTRPRPIWSTLAQDLLRTSRSCATRSDKPRGDDPDRKPRPRRRQPERAGRPVAVGQRRQDRPHARRRLRARRVRHAGGTDADRRGARHPHAKRRGTADTLALLKWGFDNFDLVTPVTAGHVRRDAPRARHGRGSTRVLLATGTYTHVVPRSAPVRTVVYARRELTGPLPKGAVAGTPTCWSADRRSRASGCGSRDRCPRRPPA